MPHAFFLFEDFGAGGSVWRRIVWPRTLLLCRAIIEVRGNHFEKKLLPLGVVLKIHDVVGKPVVHLFTCGPGKSSDVAKTYGLFLHIVEAGAVASIELFAAAARTRGNGNIGARGKIIAGEDSMCFRRIRFRSGGIGCGICGILFCRILGRLLLRGRCAWGLRRPRKGVWRCTEKNMEEKGSKNAMRKNGGRARV